MFVFQPPAGKGTPFAMMNCIDEGNNVDHAVVNTLLDVVRELSEREYGWVKTLIEQVKSGQYDQAEFAQPKWTGNACSMWFGLPAAGPSHVLIANEYVPDYSQDEGKPQRFTLQQLEMLLDAWREYKAEVARVGLHQMLGKAREMTLE